MTITDLEPKLVFGIFDEITKVPRPSKKEGKIREFLRLAPVKAVHHSTGRVPQLQLHCILSLSIYSHF